MSDTITVDATVLSDSTELRSLSEADKWLQDISERATEIAQAYQPHDIVDDADYAQAKKDRTAARKALKAIDDEKKSKTAAIKQVLRDFETRTKEATEPLRGIDSGYKTTIDAYDRHRLRTRLAAARAEYEASFPDIVPLVSFDHLDELFGKPEKWHALTTSAKRLSQSVMAHAEQIRADLATIESLPYDRDQIDDCKLQYRDTLDLQQALQAATERHRALERLRQVQTESAAGTDAATPASGVASPVTSSQGQTPDIAAQTASAAPVASFDDQWFRQSMGQASATAAVPTVDAPVDIPVRLPDYDAAVQERHDWRIETTSLDGSRLVALGNLLARHGLQAIVTIEATGLTQDEVNALGQAFGTLSIGGTVRQLDASSRDGGR